MDSLIPIQRLNDTLYFIQWIQSILNFVIFVCFQKAVESVIIIGGRRSVDGVPYIRTAQWRHFGFNDKWSSQRDSRYFDHCRALRVCRRYDGALTQKQKGILCSVSSAMICIM